VSEARPGSEVALSTAQLCRIPRFILPLALFNRINFTNFGETVMMCKILGFHGGDYEECRFLRCYAA
jgi:hypothetical protein